MCSKTRNRFDMRLSTLPKHALRGARKMRYKLADINAFMVAAGRNHDGRGLTRTRLSGESVPVAATRRPQERENNDQDSVSACGGRHPGYDGRGSDDRRGGAQAVLEKEVGLSVGSVLGSRFGGVSP